MARFVSGSGGGDRSIAGGAAAGTGSAPSAVDIQTAACPIAKSFFYTQSAALLEACPIGNGGFRRLISKAGITGIFAVNKLCMPINFGRNQWMLAS